MLLKGQQSGQWLGSAGIIGGLFESIHYELWRCRSWPKADSGERGRQGRRDSDPRKISRFAMKGTEIGDSRGECGDTMSLQVYDYASPTVLFFPRLPFSDENQSTLIFIFFFFRVMFFLPSSALIILYLYPPLSRVFTLWRG